MPCDYVREDGIYILFTGWKKEIVFYWRMNKADDSYCELAKNICDNVVLWKKVPTTIISVSLRYILYLNLCILWNSPNHRNTKSVKKNIN
mmetsp:Transcript_7345/g.12946  ORF Transcript_7345/g.12946 Transcript_7345/m.12946 type:complete len:90 (+) Transcript_7345:1369-1638(+)